MDQRLERTIAVVIAVGWVEKCTLIWQIKINTAEHVLGRRSGGEQSGSIKKREQMFLHRRSSGAVLKKYGFRLIIRKLK
ncbi:hypothetical protein T07_9568 [Trichinella nelsoni]|uniref:Uncharacterized protein n=1 Tax=Trichinella nelsoni TaxID=6336 RepID=A0A0V0SA77_9BILA|nr:hypothetical protein T07_9568 [Trichinella nelsoni]